jgi:transcription initiation factor TFIIIB Brf1 subunit/transcription initiation factor TFIIB
MEPQTDGLISKDDFEKFMNAKFAETLEENLTEDTHANYCPDCDIPMLKSGCDLNCPNCGLCQENETETIAHDETYTATIRIATGANKGRCYNTVSDYTKTQRKMIVDQLYQNSVAYKGPAFPVNVLAQAASQYNNIQKVITEVDYYRDGSVKGQKKFVRRGNIKDEILAALIFFEGIREKIYRKRKDIATFMNLPILGFARGEDILRNLHGEGKIDIPVDEEPNEGFIDRYTEALQLDGQYAPFINAIVDISEQKKIGMDSQISSKIVAAIYIVCVHCKLGITAADIEKACDNTKKNTFLKFVKTMAGFKSVFDPIFRQYGIPTH